MRWLLLVLLGLAPAAQAAFPDKPLRVLVGFAPGGTGDFTARMIAEIAGRAFGQNAVVENRTGANGAIAAEAVARSPADGSTVLQCPMGTMTIAPFLPGQRLAVDVVTELVPVVNLALSSYGLVVAAGSPYRDIPGLLAAARAAPGRLSFASAGAGSAQHLAGEMVARLADLRLVHVPYRGGAPAIVDLLGGRVDFFISNLGDVARQVQDGALRLLAMGDDAGHPLFPDTPRLSGFVPGFSIAGWFGVCGPRGMPAEAVAAWSAAIMAAVQEEPVRRRLFENGLTPIVEDTAAFAERMARDRRMFRELIGAAGIRAD